MAYTPKPIKQDESGGEIDDAMRTLLQKLTAKHGPMLGGRPMREARGVHAYFACPECLKTDGVVELQSKHLAINLDRCLVRGLRWRCKAGTFNADRSASCMKRGHSFGVLELTEMAPLSERCSWAPGAIITPTTIREVHLVDDGRGNMIPEHPGKVIPLPLLPDDHPAIEYVKSRGFTSRGLFSQFRASYCLEEKIEDEIAERYYKRFSGGFKATPQGRLIFYLDELGVQRGWQGRVLEKVDGNRKLWWHPYDGCWTVVAEREGEAQPWKLKEKYDTGDHKSLLKFPKYQIGSGTRKSLYFLGFDSCLKWHRENGRERKRVAILCEGALDAARLGMPAMCVMGKNLSPDQIRLLQKNFHTVVWVGDNDVIGKQATEKVKRLIPSALDFHTVDVPGDFKDLGEMPEAEAKSLIEKFL